MSIGCPCPGNMVPGLASHLPLTSWPEVGVLLANGLAIDELVVPPVFGGLVAVVLGCKGWLTLVSQEDAHFPLRSESYHSYHRPSFSFVVAVSGEFGFLFQFVEELGGGILSHAYPKHLAFMYFFNGGISEVVGEHGYEFGPCGIPELGSNGIVVVVGPEIGSLVHPPLLGRSFEVGGGEWYCLGVEDKVGGKHFKIGDTIPYEALDVVMGASKWLRRLHEGWLDPQIGSVRGCGADGLWHRVRPSLPRWRVGYRESIVMFVQWSSPVWNGGSSSVWLLAFVIGVVVGLVKVPDHVVPGLMVPSCF
ncbi:hypothetical protein ARMSODRAFT_1022191 [Armillaria solidipes]|uniref:Uncharacterized protein n=1 Tax=Armillaria solidipes TaxID=1076256 RepID=A0A2H3B4I8_9AGAR|nr:hypothetical protein ARMSODRAFT_1022191 [Armillaria solidipes]